MRRRWLATAGAAAIGCAAPAYAQLPARDVRISAGTDVTAETNVARVNDENRAQRLRGLSASDLRVTPTVDVTAVLPIAGRHLVNVTGVLSYNIYMRNDRLNRERILLASNGLFNLGNCEVSYNGAYRRAQSDLGDLIVFDGVDVLDRRVVNTEDVKTIGGNVSCGSSFGLRPTLGITQSWANNSDAIRRINNYSNTTLTAGIAYRRPRLGDLSLFASKTWARYPNRDDLAGPFGLGSTGNNIRSYGVSLSRPIGSRLTGSASISYTDVNQVDMVGDSFGGLTWSADLTAVINPRLVARLGLGRSVQTSNLVFSSYTIDNNYSLSADYTLSDRVRFSLSASRLERDFQGTIPFVATPLVNDELTRLDGVMAFVQSRRLSFRVFASHSIRNANTDLLDYDNTTVGVGTRLTL